MKLGSLGYVAGSDETVLLDVLKVHLNLRIQDLQCKYIQSLGRVRLLLIYLHVVLTKSLGCRIGLQVLQKSNVLRETDSCVWDYFIQLIRCGFRERL